MKLVNLILKNSNNLDKNAFVSNSKIYSYNLLCQYLQALIYDLQNRGLRAKNRVIMIADHDEDAIIFLAAASALELQIIMPYNLQNTAIQEWNNIIIDTSPDFIVYLKKDRDKLHDIIANDCKIIELRLEHYSNSLINNKPSIYSDIPVDNFLILYTSGTTGSPKAIMISEELVYKRILSVTKKLKFNQNSRIWMSGLINNTTGIIFSFGALYHGATLFFPDSRDVTKWLIQIKLNNISHMMLRPVSLREFIQKIVEIKLELPALEVIAYGASSLDVNLLELAQTLIPCQWIQGYGLSETFGPFCWLDETDHKNKRYFKSVYCIGKPDETMEIKIEDGELLIRGDMLMRGYYSPINKAIKSRSEWFSTGDYVELSEDGYLNLKGRISATLLSRNGHKIYPEEVENIIRQINYVEDALLVNFSV